MDLKQGIELLKVNKTFKVILSTLRSVGNFLNGSHVKGFRLEYLSKVMEVKDTVHKHPLLYHICEMIIEKFPDSTDFFSEVSHLDYFLFYMYCTLMSIVKFSIQYIKILNLTKNQFRFLSHINKITKKEG